VKSITDIQPLFISDVLLYKLVNGCYGHKFSDHKQRSATCPYPNKCPSELNTSGLLKLLQKSAVEHLTTFRQLQAQEFGSLFTIVTTDFEALYAYKRGDYQQCLQLSTQNVHTLLYADQFPKVPILPEFISFLDDDIVSLTALTLMVNPEWRRHFYGACISQLTLSLYLMTQCQLKLRHSVASLSKTLELLRVDIQLLVYWTI